MSFIGVISIPIVLVSVAALMLHARVMRKRAPVDIYMAELEDQLRERLEMIYAISTPESMLHELCNGCIDLEFTHILKSMPDINDALEAERGFHESQAVHELDSNAETIRTTNQNLNQAVDEYNNFIQARLHDVLMARVLGLETVELINL